MADVPKLVPSATGWKPTAEHRLLSSLGKMGESFFLVFNRQEFRTWATT